MSISSSAFYLRLLVDSRSNQNMNGPLTVGIITHNEELRLKECLSSLEFLKSNVPDFHVVLVDNNSTDKTLILADQTLKQLQIPFTLVKRDLNNLAAARNDILKNAKTRWIYMLDADCKLDAATWPHLVQDWKEDSMIAARAGSQKFCPIHEILFLLDEMRKSYLGHFGSAQMKSTGDVEFLEHVSTTHILYDKNALDAVGGFNPELSVSAEDLDLSLRLRKKGYHLQFNPKSFLWHDQARTWKDWASKAFRNGIWQTRLAAYNPEILKTRRPWPGILLFFVPFIPFEILAVGVVAYLVIISILCLKAKIKFVQKIKLFGLFVMTHFLYATGEMVGVLLALIDKLPSSTKA